ncbi:hypothetical protein E4U17_006389 [Claviceps sp. LM77 group G4]|nr:hypothetical protein E4U17_006389 [Claviceps sp. LM77 group G4]KAG6085251.1 hypothetical protein E4U16_006842 [Claviceps sp. LM84 group G4]KAG6086093.1 hypothetical protein E4U33_000091 [Claviceps sp. LM78 group G4]
MSQLPIQRVQRPDGSAFEFDLNFRVAGHPSNILPRDLKSKISYHPYVSWHPFSQPSPRSDTSHDSDRTMAPCSRFSDARPEEAWPYPPICPADLGYWLQNYTQAVESQCPWMGITPHNTLEAGPLDLSDSITESPLSTGTPNDVLASQLNLMETRGLPWSMEPPASAFASGSASTSVHASPGPESSKADVRDMAESDKIDEPYARLICRALLSRDDHTMSVQEIYTWFRENTKKAEALSTGWTNSIRHNLSLNAAFVKTESIPLDNATPKSKSKSKSKSKGSTHTNKWVLADWAVAEGVQSTTRYRNQVYARRAPGKRARTAASDRARTSSSSSSFSPSSSSCVLDQSAKKAISGRKGGCATKAARQRTQRLRDCRPGGGGPLYESPQQTLDLERAHPSAYGCGDAIPMSYHPLALHHQPYQEVPAVDCGNVLESSQHFGGGGGGFSGPGFAQFSGNSDGNSCQNWGSQAFQPVGLYLAETGTPLSLFSPDTGANSWLPPLSQQPFGIPGEDDTQAASLPVAAGPDFGAWNGRPPPSVDLRGWSGVGQGF